MGALAPDDGSVISAAPLKVIWSWISASYSFGGLLQPGRSDTISWSRGADRVGSISLIAEVRSLRRSYRSTTSEGSAEVVDECIEIRPTSTSFGGTGSWFGCPRGNRPCRILYGGPRFWCRLCHGLRYESQFESRAQRANRRARKIRRRLYGSDALPSVGVAGGLMLQLGIDLAAHQHHHGGQPHPDHEADNGAERAIGGIVGALSLIHI